MNQSKTSGSAKSAPASTAAPRAADPSARPAGTGSRSGPSTPAAAPVKATAHPGQPAPQTGKVVHDERGNAVWDWLKQTGRNAIESTTRMLRKLESPELKVEQTHEEELRIQPDSDNCTGGGYDPYNQPTKSRRTPTK
jgi:hypothetical protein